MRMPQRVLSGIAMRYRLYACIISTANVIIFVDTDFLTYLYLAAYHAVFYFGGSLMALPPGRLGESHARSSTSKMLGWLYRVWISLSRPLFAVVLAMVAGSILILITAPG